MDNFAFIIETDGNSGKVTSPRARRTIRTHVMKNHRTNRTSSNVQVAEIPSSQRAPPRKSRAIVSDQPGTGKHTASSCENVGSVCSEPSKRGSHLALRQARHVESPCRHMTRSTDAFIYAGSSIDIKSYGFFNHYSCEFHVILCSPIQPLPLVKTSLCCSTAIRENSAALLHAICYTAAAHEAIARHIPDNPLNLLNTSHPIFSTQDDTLRHKALALNLLTKQLTQDPTEIVITEAAILCVTVLLAAEVILGDSAAIVAHTNGLIRMIKLFGGEDLLSPTAATHVNLVDVKSAMLLQMRPSFPLRPYLRRHFDNLSARTFQPEDATLFFLGSRFLSRPLSGKISPLLQQCLQYTCHLISMVEQYHHSRQLSDTYNINDFLALENILLALRYEYSLDALENCIRLALLLYSNTALWITPLYFAWVASLVCQLQAALLALDWQEITQEHPELLLWILLLGRYAASSMYTEGEAAWWTAKVRLIVSILGVRQWNEARQIVKGFLYVDRVCSGPWQTIWGNVVLGDETRLRAMKHPCDRYG